MGEAWKVFEQKKGKGLVIFFFGTRPGPPSNFERARAKKNKIPKKNNLFWLQNQCCAQKKNFQKKNIRKKKLLKFSNFFFYTFLCTPHRHIFFYFLFFIFGFPKI